MIRTAFTDMFGLECPVMSAPMAMHSGGTLAAAVSGAGGLGGFGGIGVGGVGWLRAEIARVRASTDRPFAVGFITQFLPMMTELFEAALEARVPVIALSFAPAQPWLSRAHAVGSKVICQVQTLELARDAIDAGADAIAVQGNEAGGHTGTMALLPFLARVLDLEPGRPVLAAGGIGSGRALAAVLAAGADGGWIGTPFLATPEAIEVPEAHKQFIVDSDGQDTVFSTLYDRVNQAPWPEPIGLRMRRDRVLATWEGREAEALMHRDEVAAQWRAIDAFDPDQSPVLYGQSSASVERITPAADVVRDLAGNAERHLRGLSRLVL